MLSHKIWVIAGFFGVLLVGLLLDLGLLHKGGKHSPMTLAQSAKRSAAWFGLGLLATWVISWVHPFLHDIAVHAPAGQEQEWIIEPLEEYRQQYHASFELDVNRPEQSLQNFKTYAATAFFTGYLVEYALSVDNLFVMLLIFQAFRVGAMEQKEILVWGVIGAIVLRALFVFLGSALVQQFHAVLYGFGILLLYSGFKLFWQKADEESDPLQHPVLKWLRGKLPISEKTPEGVLFRFKEQGKTWFTPLFLVLVLVELTDVVFAVDSVPAIFGITTDPYLVFFSNILAVMGLRSLYFLLGHSLDKFYALQYGLSLILVFIGAKMLLEPYFHAIGFTHVHNLMVILGILMTSILWSLGFPKRATGAAIVEE